MQTQAGFLLDKGQPLEMQIPVGEPLLGIQSFGEVNRRTVETGSQAKEIGILRVVTLVTVEVDSGIIDSHHLAIEWGEIHQDPHLIKGRGYANSMRVDIARKDLNVIIYTLEVWELNLSTV